MNNYLESYYTRKTAIRKIFEKEKLPYTETEMEHTAGAWANCNMSLEEISFMIKNADKPEMEDIVTKHDLKVAMEAEPLKMGVIPK